MNPSPEVSQENSPSRSRAAIVVLGVARSGTSLLTHLLNILGAKLPEQLLGAGQGNPLGHWEPMRLLEINEEILRKLGRTWHDPGLSQLRGALSEKQSSSERLIHQLSAQLTEQVNQGAPTLALF